MDAAETVLDVSLYRPLVTAGRVDEEPHLLDGVLRSTVGPEAVGARLELRLPDRLQHQRRRHLNDPVAKSGNAQPSDLPGSSLGDLVLAHRQRGIRAVPERLTELTQDLLHALLLDVPACLAINTGGLRPPVAFHPLPRDEQRRGVTEQVEQIVEALLLILRCPAVQLGLPSQYPLLRLLGVERRGRIHVRPPRRLRMPRSCCRPSPCGRLSRPRSTTAAPPRPGRISGHRASPAATRGRQRQGRFPRSP